MNYNVNFKNEEFVSKNKIEAINLSIDHNSRYDNKIFLPFKSYVVVDYEFPKDISNSEIETFEKNFLSIHEKNGNKVEDISIDIPDIVLSVEENNDF